MRACVRARARVCVTERERERDGGDTHRIRNQYVAIMKQYHEVSPLGVARGDSISIGTCFELKLCQLVHYSKGFTQLFISSTFLAHLRQRQRSYFRSSYSYVYIFKEVYF